MNILQYKFIVGSPIHHQQQKTSECGGSPIHQYYTNSCETSVPITVKDLPLETYDPNNRNSPLHTSPYASTSSNLGSPVHHQNSVIYSQILTSANTSPVFGSQSNTPTSISSITQGLSGLNTTGSITQGIPPSANLQLDLRQQQQQDDSVQYASTTPYQTHHVHHILNIHNHRSLTNSPISNPGSPGLDMIQEEMIQHACCGKQQQEMMQQQQQAGGVVCHPQISVTDVLGKFFISFI